MIPIKIIKDPKYVEIPGTSLKKITAKNAIRTNLRYSNGVTKVII